MTAAKSTAVDDHCHAKYMPSPNETRPNLLALRYVGDEMSSVERAEFESLLAESQAAREAVATAVMLFAAVPLAAGELRPAAGSADAFAGSQGRSDGCTAPAGRPWARPLA